jgi:uncharacterized membrane protein YedE/YeeE
MAQLVLAFIAGGLFAIGLIVSQMVNPAKVLNFLDIAGQWDPTLAFVMGGALLVTIPGFRLVLQRARPLLAERFQLPTKQDLDPRLVIGAVLFGIGWGIAGLCPGPALTALASGLLPVVGFVATMIVGALTYKLAFER